MAEQQPEIQERPSLCIEYIDYEYVIFLSYPSEPERDERIKIFEGGRHGTYAQHYRGHDEKSNAYMYSGDYFDSAEECIQDIIKDELWSIRP